MNTITTESSAKAVEVGSLPGGTYVRGVGIISDGIYREAVKYLLTLFGLAALITIVVLAASALGHATTTQHRNSLGVPMYTVNPYIYEAGEIVDYAIVEKGEGLSIRVKPLATYLLFDDNLLFCGVPADKINGHENPMVLVYERVAHKTIGGVGCHELVEVRSIKAEKPE